MLQLPERDEKICLNCNAEIIGRYCHQCSQENVEPQQSFGHVIIHFLLHFTHFDTRTFRTLKFLFGSPGFLSEEYVKGRRERFVDPLRLYMTISAVLFACLLAMQKKKVLITKETHPEIVHFVDSVRANVKITEDDRNMIESTIRGIKVYVYLWEDKYTHGINHYDSLQQAITQGKKMSFMERWWDRKYVQAYERYNKDPYNANRRLWDNVYLSVSKMFFISMPAFVLILYLLYFRKRKEYYFISHAIFSLHFYCIIWFFLLIGIAYKKTFAIIGLGEDNPVVQTLVKYGALLCILGGILYLFLAMRRFYKQSIGKILVKTTILSVLTVAFLLFETMIIYFMSYGYL